MVATGVVHVTGKLGEAAHDQPFSYQITPKQLARSVLHELNLEAMHVTAIRRRLPAAQVMTIFYEDLLRQAEGSTWAGLLRHLNVAPPQKPTMGRCCCDRAAHCTRALSCTLSTQCNRGDTVGGVRPVARGAAARAQLRDPGLPTRSADRQRSCREGSRLATAARARACSPGFEFI